MAEVPGELIESLVEDVALTGNYGLSYDKLKKKISLWYRNRDEQLQQHQISNDSTETPSSREITSVDDDLLDKVWDRLAEHARVSVGDIAKVYKEAESEACADSKHPDVRLFAELDLQWKALTGSVNKHRKTVSRLLFNCLSIIGAHGTAGVLQPDLRRITGQQKQSIPRRTDTLAQSGFINKRAVLAQGSKTSLLRLKRFVDRHGQDAPGTAPSTIVKHPSGVTVIDYDNWFKDTIRLMQAQPNQLLAVQDLRIGLGIHLKKYETRALMRCIRRMAANGIMRKCSVKPVDDHGPLDGAPVRCLQLMREPTAADRETWKRNGNKRKRPNNDGVLDDSDEDQEAASDDDDEAADDRIVAAEDEDMDGDADAADASEHQAEHLADGDEEDEASHSSDRDASLGNILEPGSRVARHLTPDDGAEYDGNAPVNHDTQEPFPDPLNHSNDNATKQHHSASSSLGDNETTARPDDSVQVSDLMPLPSKPKRQYRKKQKQSGVAVEDAPDQGTQISRAFTKPRLTSMNDQPEFEKWAKTTAARLVRNETLAEHDAPADENGEEQYLAAGDGLASLNEDQEASDQPAPTSEGRLAQVEADLLSKSRPGIYINPPGARDLKALSVYQRGRPRKALIAVVKSDDLHGLEYFKDDMPKVAPKPPKRRNDDVDESTTPKRKRKMTERAVQAMATQDAVEDLLDARHEDEDDDTAADMSVLEADEPGQEDGSLIYSPSALRNELALYAGISDVDKTTYKKDHVEAHPDEEFHYAGGGMWRRGSRPPKRKRGLPAQTPARRVSHPQESTPSMVPSVPGASTSVLDDEEASTSPHAHATHEGEVSQASEPVEDTQVYSKDHVEAHPHEAFYHAGNGRWRRGTRPAKKPRMSTNDHSFIQYTPSPQAIQSMVRRQSKTQNDSDIAETSAAPKADATSAETAPPPSTTPKQTFEKDYVDAHPDEQFHHVGAGRWRCGPRPTFTALESPSMSGFTADTPISVTNPMPPPPTTPASTPVDNSLYKSAYVRQYPEEVFHHVGGGSWKRGPRPTKATPQAPPQTVNIQGSPESSHETPRSATALDYRLSTRRSSAIETEATTVPATTPTSQTTPTKSSSAMSTSALPPKKRGRPSKVMLAERERLREHDTESKIPSMIVKLKVPSLGLQAAAQAPQNKLRQEQGVTGQPLLAIVRPYYEPTMTNLSDSVPVQQSVGMRSNTQAASDSTPSIGREDDDAELQQIDDQVRAREAHADLEDPDFLDAAASAVQHEAEPEGDAHSGKPDHKEAQIKVPKKRGPKTEAIGKERTSIVLDIMNQCGGVFPGRGEIYHPFLYFWRQSRDSNPDRRTLESTIKTLVTTGKLKKVTFTFRTKQGANETRSLLALPTIEPTSKVVEELKQEMIQAYPIQYLPPEFAWTVAELDEKTNANRGWKNEFPMLEELTVQRTAESIQIADEGARAKGFESAHARRQERARVRARRSNARAQSAQASDALSTPDPTASAPAGEDDGTLFRGFQDDLHAQQQDSDTTWTPVPTKRRRLSVLGGLRGARGGRAGRGGRGGRGGMNARSSAMVARHGLRQDAPASNDKRATGYRITTSRRLLMGGKQSFHCPSGTFGTDVLPGSLRDDVNGHPGCLNDVLSRADRLGERQAGQLAGPQERFNRDVDRVSAWEHDLARRPVDTSTVSGWVFINHHLDRPHSVAEPESREWTFVMDGPEQASSDTRHSMLGPFPSATPQTASVRQVLTVRRGIRPLLKPNARIYEREYLDSHPDERFVHCGGGRYRRVADIEKFVPNGTPPLISAPTPRTFATPYSQQMPGMAQEPARWDPLPPAIPWYALSQTSGLQSLGTVGAQALVSPPMTQPPPTVPVNVNDKSTRQYRSRKRKNSADADPFDPDLTVDPAIVDAPSPKKLKSAPSKTKQFARGGARVKLDDFEHDVDLMVAIALLRVLTGGVQQSYTQWGLVAQTMGFQYEPDFLYQRWASLKQRVSEQTVNLQVALREPFLAAYERDELPAIDFQNLAATDWPRLLEWARTAVELPNITSTRGPRGGSNGVELPASTQELHERYFVAEHPSLIERDEEVYFKAIGNIHRTQAALRYIEGSAVTTGSPQQTTNGDMLQSWCRAISMTKRAYYDPAAAAQKISVFPDIMIQRATESLTMSQILAADKKDRQLPGRNFSLHKQAVKQFRRWPDEDWKFLRDVAAARERIIEHFDSDDTLELSPHALDPEIVVLTNMVAQGFLQVSTVLPPRNDDIDAPFPKLSIWGVDDISTLYDSKHIDQSRLRFPVMYHWTSEFTPEHGLAPNIPIPVGEERIPFWIDIHGNVIDEAWDMALRSVLHLLVYRPGCMVRAMEKAHDGKLWAWEIELMVQWMEQTGLAIRTGAGKEVDGVWKGGWRASEWWYCAFADDVATWKVPVGEWS